MDKCNRTESSEIKPCIYDQLNYDKGNKKIQWGKDNLLINKWCLENWMVTCKKNNIGLPFTPYTKINSKWIKDLHVRPEVIKLLKENIGSNLSASATYLWICLLRQGKQKQK